MPFPHLVRPVVARDDELLELAQQLFADKGYEATTIEHIAARAGLSRDAFQQHFQSKEDLVEALACRFARVAAAQTEHLLRDPTLDAFSKLTMFLTTVRRRKIESAHELRATFEPLFRAENQRLYERTQRAVREVVRPLLTRIIAEGVTERTFDTPDPESAAETIMHLLTANRELIGELYATRDRREFQRLSERLLVKVGFIATVIDRILGLPEGSIELADRGAIDALACTLDDAPRIA